MTPQEQQLLMQLAQRINQTQLQEKDPEAENLLGRELGANSDATYILAQTVLVQNIALDQARTQIAQLQQQAQQQPARTTSFLGRLLGEHDNPAPQPAPYQPSQYQPSQYQPSQYQPSQAPAYQPVPPSPYSPPSQYQQPQFTPQPPGQPSFLRGAMQTAAGVAAGALAFEGVESILHGFGHSGSGPGYGMSGFGMTPGMGMMGGFERPAEETVVNNYYGQPGADAGEHHADAAASQPAWQDGGQGTRVSDSAFDPSGNQAGSDPSLIDTSYDSSADDVQLDESGSQDESGSFDYGGGFDSSDDLS